MAREIRPKDYPKLKNYQPTRFMLPTSHYDRRKQTGQLLSLRICVIRRVNGRERDSGCYRGRNN